MKKTDFVSALAASCNIPAPNAQKLLNAFLDSVEDALCRDGKLSLRGFGTFSVQTHGQRKSRNPLTGEEIIIPPTKSVKFTPAESLKSLIKNQE